ncbi:PilZ domain-containing protein [Vibrio sp. WJH972]
MIEQEYFTVHHAIAVNVEPMASDFSLPDAILFEAEIPAPFIVANEFSQLDHLNESAKTELRNSDFRHVIQLLDTQNSKLNLLLTYMLAQQDDQQYRTKTRSFGASQFSYYSRNPLDAHTILRAKMFLENPAAAIYCYGEVTECETTDQGYVITVKYVLIRDLDQDLIIKAALFQQQKLLRQRSLERDSK